MTARDPAGRYTPSDPLRRWKQAKDAEDAQLVDRMFGRDPQLEPEPVEDKPPGPASFDGGPQGEPTAGKQPGMDDALREAVGEHRGGAKEVTIEVHPDEIRRY